MSGEIKDLVEYNINKLKGYLDKHLNDFFTSGCKGQRQNLINKLNEFYDSDFFKCSWREIPEGRAKGELRKKIFEIKHSHTSHLGFSV